MAQGLHFEISQSKLLSPLVPKTRDQIIQQYDEFASLEEIYLRGDISIIHNFIQELNPCKKIVDLPEGITKDAVLSPHNINHMALFIENYSSLCAFLGDSLQQANIKKEELRSLQNIITRNFRTFVDRSGTVDYLRHPELRELYQKIQQIEVSIRKTLEHLVNDSLYKNSLRFTQHDCINDRYVLAIRSDSYNSKQGHIIYRSDTGITLYVEPHEIRKLCSDRIELLVKLEEKINSICMHITRSLAPFTHCIENIINFFYDLDLLLAKVEFSIKKNMNRPEISDDFSLELKDFFHPLIDNSIKNDFELNASDHGYIISGPNTGGKTVTLKAIATSLMFMHLGVYIPAKRAKLPVCNNIYFFGNDGQNLSQGISSFASEVYHYIELLKEFDSNDTDKLSLIFFDEIFNSTSSEEASALAITLFKHLSNISNVQIVASTHHQMLKAYLQKEPGYLSGHVGFDEQNMVPTFRLISGTPGSSMALSIFKRLSKKLNYDCNLSEEAQKMLDKKMVFYESLLQELSKKELELDKVLKHNQEINQRLSNQEKSVDGVLKLKMKDRLDRYDIKLSKYIKRAERLLDEVKDQKIGRNVFVRQSNELKSVYNRENQQFQRPAVKTCDVGETPDELIIGKKYFCTLSNGPVILKSINDRKDEVEVIRGNNTLRCQVSKLLTLKKKSVAINKDKSEFNIYREDDFAPYQHDCRGMRLEDFQNYMENILTDLKNEDLKEVLIIHGHGTGVLKSYLRKTVEKIKELTWTPDNNSGDGATIIRNKHN